MIESNLQLSASSSGTRQPEDYAAMIRQLCQTAICGLSRCYPGDDILPHTARLGKGDAYRREGMSFRYAAISQIGISRWIQHHPDDKGKLPDLWSALVACLASMDDIGDTALTLWAGAQSGAKNLEKAVEQLSANWKCQSESCNAVELAWVVQACVLAKGMGVYKPIPAMLGEAYGRLVKLFDEEANLFRRHTRRGIREAVSRRIACFADQVYPILALTSYGESCQSPESAAMAERAVDTICRWQGDLGQWWWHYDVPGGKICEEYPVFSVHQDGMAPMVIIANDRATGRNHVDHIELGVRWLFGQNELKENLVLPEEGIIWRDIERREPSKFSRKARGLCCVVGCDGFHRYMGRLVRSFKVNYECRPYHLGWVLYAWADFRF